MIVVFTEMRKGETIMKKRSTFIVFLAALLCLTMLFASCDFLRGNTDDDINEETNNAQDMTLSEEPAASVERVDYTAKLREWEKYVSYKAPENMDIVNSAFSYYGNSENSTYSIHGDLLYVRQTNYINDYYNGTVTSTSHYVYNLVSGTQIVGVTGSRSDVSSTEKRTSYSVDFLADGAIFLVRRTVATPSANSYGAWISVIYYTFYDAAGNTLETFSSDVLDDSTAYGVETYSTYSYVTISDKCYVCTGGEIVATFAAEEVRGVPTVTREYNGYKYTAFENGVIRVYDANYNETARYEAELGWEDAYRQVYYLENGDLYIQYMSYNADKTNYTAYSGDMYMLIKNVHVSVSTGEVTYLDPTFYVADMISAADMAEDRRISINGEYQLATIVKINADKTMAYEYSYVVLDNNMKTVAELPYILKDQMGLITALDADTYIVPTAATMGSSYMYNYYTVDRNNGRVSLYDIEDVMSDRDDRQYIEGGFIANDILYSENNTELSDLRYVYDYSIVKNKVVLVEEAVDGKTVKEDPALNHMSYSSPYTFTLTPDGKLVSNNQKQPNTTAEATFTADRYMGVTIRYSVSSEGSYDIFTITHYQARYDYNYYIESGISGEVTSNITVYLEEGDTLTFMYSKDGSADYGDDCATIHSITIEGEQSSNTSNVELNRYIMYIDSNGYACTSGTIDGTIYSTYDDFFITRGYNESSGETYYALYNITGGFVFSADRMDVVKTLSDGVLIRCYSPNNTSYTYYTVK